MRQRGDTIIEVILAVTIFSFVAVSALTLMNSGLSMAQRALEITLVRQQLDSQAEILRFVSQSAAHQELWAEVKDRAVTATPYSVLNRDTCPTPSAMSANRPFAFAATGSGIQLLETFNDTPTTYARVVHETAGGVPRGSQGISIQLVRPSGEGAYDAYVQACWMGPGSSRPATIGTIVRMYEPDA